MLHSLNALPSSKFNPSLNFVQEENPFGLSSPPNWFLEDLWNFDPCLVIFPSKEEALYRLARRAEHGAPVVRLLTGRPDTGIFVKHRLVPVTSILPSPMVQWGPVLLKDLAERDIRRQGGFKRAASLLDQQDADADAKWHRENADGAEVRARASWRGQKWTNGQSLDLGARKNQGARTGARKTHYPGRIDPRLRPAHSGDGALFGHDRILQEATPYFDETPSRESRIIIATA
jgi:hypothetical protein